MHRIKILLSILILVSGCALYAEIPEEYLAPKKIEIEKTKAVKSESAPASMEVAQKEIQKVSKKYPQASEKNLQQFVEKEKEILASRVYEVIFDKKPILEKIVSSFPDLTHFGNEATLEAYSLQGFIDETSSADGSLLENVAGASRRMRTSKTFQKAQEALPSSDQIYFKLKISSLDILIWGGELEWREVIDGRYFLPITKLSPKLVQGRWILNRHFLKAYWPVLKKYLDKESNLSSSAVIPWLNHISLRQAQDIPVDEGTDLIKRNLMNYLTDYDPELSFVAQPNGQIDLEKTALLTLLLLKTEKWEEVTPVLEPLIATLLFLHNEDGSFQAGITEEEIVQKNNPVIPLILKVYLLLQEKGDEAFRDAFKRSFSYYFPTRFDALNEVEPRLIWGRLLL
jgi:hypothetical protein